MKAIVFYLVQLFFASGLLYGYYHFFLRNKKFHQYNRFYLLAAVIVSLFIPFLNIPLYFSDSSMDQVYVLKTLENITTSAKGESSDNTGFISWPIWMQSITILYVLASIVLIIRIIISLLKINRIIGKHQVEELEGVHFLNTSEPGTPYSFFRWLFWNKKIALDSESGQKIFKHEVYHIRQQHTVDVMFIEILLIIGWVNPFFFLIKRELRTIHEFLADQYAMNETGDWEYAELLLKQALETQTSLVNPFFHNQIKRRIAMITSSNQVKYRYLRKLMVIPLAGITLGLFAFTYHRKESRLPVIQDQVKEIQVLSIDTVPSKPYVITEDHKIESSQKAKVNSITLRPVTTDTAPKSSVTKIRIGEPYGNQPLYIVDGKKQAAGEINNIDANTIESLSVWKDAEAIKKYGDAGKNGVIDIKLKKGYTIKPDGKDTSQLKEITIQDRSSYTVDDKVFDKVEVNASFKGGALSWRKFLETNLNGNTPVDHKAPVGMYTVFVQFIVKADGSLEDIKALTRHGYGMEDEVVRLIKISPKWDAAIQNGKVVNAYVKQPVTFQVADDAKDFVPATIYPNPSNNTAKIEISVPIAGSSQITIVDINGRSMSTQKQDLLAGKNIISLNTDKLTKGSYKVTVTIPGSQNVQTYSLGKL